MMGQEYRINAWGNYKYFLDFMLWIYLSILAYIVCPPFTEAIDNIYKIVRRFI